MLFMKYLSILCILLSICSPGFSQYLRGRVLDSETKKAIELANVFINSTTIGALTDKDGSFTLNLSGAENLPIAVTAIGYHSLLLTDYTTDKPYQILLNTKTYELGEVVVKAKRTFKERAERSGNLAIFRKEFLGQSANALRSKIINENDIIFQNVEGKDMIKAWSPRPLIIKNDALGYEITYYLDTFEYSPFDASVRIFGNYIFRDVATEGSAREKAENRRRLTYLGSTMHFFRCLWNNNLDSAGYTIKDNGNNVLHSYTVSGKEYSGGRYITTKGDINIYYLSKMNGTTFALLRDSAFYDKSGYFDPVAINWNGVMAKQRVADLLPFDYIYKPRH
jgi:hypothetical protein